MPNDLQLKSSYRICDRLTFTMLQPIHLVCVDKHTKNIYILAGLNEEIEFEITLNGATI